MENQPNSPPKHPTPKSHPPQIQKYSLNPTGFPQIQKYIQPPKNKTPQNPHPKNKKNKKAAYSDRQPARKLVSQLAGFCSRRESWPVSSQPRTFPNPVT